MVNHEETGIFNPVVHFSNWIYNYAGKKDVITGGLFDFMQCYIKFNFKIQVSKFKK